MGDPGPNNNGIAVLSSIFASIMSIGVVLNAIWLNQQATTHCDHIFDIPLIIMSSFLMALSILGIYGAFIGIHWILLYYGRALFILILLMYGLTVIALVVTTKSPGLKVPGKGYMVENHQSWLKRRVNKNWNKITIFLQQTKICDHNLNGTNANLSSIQYHCCKPSNDCSNSTSTNPDCNKWSSDEKVLCYGCESCKIAWTNRIRPNWRRATITNFVLLVLIVAGNIVVFHNVHQPVPISRVTRNEGSATLK
ncbi:tetraspanin-9-like [Impatiens glandulifera]|uniref:tetraspanin-9-like n=1 Tax=Impatiens glandulifera TaxID=253017 RepID=UPI001FB05F1C|nr:tetraspanin-9-like [Impatiens glandulifera]